MATRVAKVKERVSTKERANGTFLGELVGLVAVAKEKVRARKAEAVEIKKGGKHKGGQKGGKAGPNQCKVCYGYGHWSNECPHKMDVNQVQQEEQQHPVAPQQAQHQQPGGSPQRGGASSNTTYVQPQAQQAGQGTVRRIFHLVPSPPTSPTTSKQVRMVLVEEVIEDDFFEQQVQHVTDEEEWIILDSGSDVSLLPARFANNLNKSGKHRLRNCQGGSLQTKGTRHTDLEVKDSEGEFVLLRHEFIVGDVPSGLLSLGQLYQSGWKIISEESDDLYLVDPNREVKIPVHFKNKSFAIRAHVRHVEIEYDSDESMFARAVVAIFYKVEDEDMNTWEMTEEGAPFYKTIGDHFIDPRPVWGQYWPYRTTLIRKRQGEDRNWLLVELAQKYMEKDDPFGPIEECLITMGGLECEVLTVLGVREHGIEEIGNFVTDEEDDFLYAELQEEGRRRAQGAVSLPPGLPAVPEDPQGGPDSAPIQVAEDEADVESIHLYDDFYVSNDSKVKDLRVACKWLGVSQAGSKSKMFSRLKQAHLTSLRRSAVEVANMEYKSEEHPAEPAAVAGRQPSHRERMLHELTHLPYRDWCQFCVATRGRGEYKKSVADPEEAVQRDKPTIQADFFFCEHRGSESEAKAILLMVDTWTRYIGVEPIDKKTARSVGEALSRFIGIVGHVGAVELCGDNEHVLVAGMEFCKSIRGKHGFPTVVTTNKNYDKSRTGMAERGIQTVRNLQKTLIAQLEHETQCVIPAGHPMLYWSAIHAGWLYNRYHTHSSIKITPYQAVNGRPYKNRVACFGQCVLGLNPKGSKYRPLWQKGTWLGKDDVDHDVVATSTGTILRARSIRKTAHEWISEDILALKIGPWDTTGYTHSKTKVQPLLALHPRRAPRRRRDVDAEAVAGLPYSDSEEEEEPNQGGGESRERKDSDGYSPTSPAKSVKEEQTLVPMQETPATAAGTATATPAAAPTQAASSSSSSAAKALGAATLPLGREPMEVESSRGSKHTADTALNEPEGKMLKLDDAPLPEPKVKAAKTEVRMIGEVEVCHNDEIGLEEDWDIFPDLEAEDELLQRGEGDGPPTGLSTEKLAELDGQAALDEIEKLNSLGVIEPLEKDLSEIPSESLVDTTVALDWRFRDGTWKRRCRIVAREFRTGNTDEGSFAPTSTFGAVRLLLILSMIFDLSVTSADVKDAFLLVPQQETMFVIIPDWIRALDPGSTANVWRLKRCLPGQRNAALRWYEFFAALCTKADMEPYKGCPTVMKMTKGNHRLYVTIHVDDILIVGNKDDLEWFKQNVVKNMTVKIDGPHKQGSGDVVMYLKKRMTMLPDGILVQPNNTYIPKLTEMLKISNRRKKGLPHHATLESYNPEVPEPETLTDEEVKLFRSALGLILYVSHDRPDISFATKTLATWMAHPCDKAMAAVKHLALYLSGSTDGGVMLKTCEAYDNVFDRWEESEEVLEPLPTQRGERAVFNIDVFSDSSWGDDKGTRRSTSSSVIYVNGAYVCGFSRTQSSIALSSCEAELYASNAAVAEGLFIMRLCKFLCGDNTDENSSQVKMRLFTDSAAAMGTVQRKGLGRMKHLQIRHLYLQELLRMKVLSIHKIGTSVNPADLGTKKLSVERRRQLCKLIGIFPYDDDLQDSRNEIHQTRRVQSMIMKAFQAAALTMLKGCETSETSDLTGGAMRGTMSTSSVSSTMWSSLSSWTTTTWSATLLGSLLGGSVVVMALSGMMFPQEQRGASSSTATRPEVPDPENEVYARQQTKLARVFMMLARDFWIEWALDEQQTHRAYYHLRLATTASNMGYYEVVDAFLESLNSDEFDTEAEVIRMEEVIELERGDFYVYEHWLWKHFKPRMIGNVSDVLVSTFALLEETYDDSVVDTRLAPDPQPEEGEEEEMEDDDPPTDPDGSGPEDDSSERRTRLRTGFNVFGSGPTRTAEDDGARPTSSGGYGGSSSTPTRRSMPKAMAKQMGWSSSHGEAANRARETRKMERDMHEAREALQRTIQNLTREANVALMQADYTRVQILEDEIENLRNLHTSL